MLEKTKRNIDIILIVLVGFSLRFVASFLHSYSNDELSAISRLRFTSFHDLITEGVMKWDMHPAGVQVFMKVWAVLFGTSEPVMRLPFVLSGTAAIYVVFLIGKQWFDRKTGLIAAGFLAVLYFPILNSEFARPYSPGLLITLSVGYFLYKLLFEEKRQLRNAIILGCIMAAGMYTHYFAFLSIGFIGLSGLIFLNRSNWKYYLLSGALAVVLFVPHIEVTYYHLNRGGLQWLAPPENDWLLQFLFHAFNESWAVISMTLALIIIALWQKKPENWTFNKRNIGLATLWFFGIYALGHILSLISTPVLKFPVMLFVFPYLLLILGVVLSRIKTSMAIIGAILSVGVISTVTEQHLFKNNHFALFREPGVKIAEWNATYGNEEIYTIYNINNPFYMNFYANEWGGDSIQFDWHELEFSSDIEIHSALLQRLESYCVIGYSSRITLPQVYETVREFYPVVVDYEQYNNGAVFLMGKGDPSTPASIKTFATFNSGDTANWTFDNDKVNYDSSGKMVYLLDTLNPFGPVFQFNKRDLPDWENYYLKVEVEADILTSGMLTVAFTGEREGETIQYRGENMWIGHDLEQMINASANNTGYFAFKIPPYLEPEDELKISLWNRGQSNVSINAFKIYVVENIWN